MSYAREAFRSIPLYTPSAARAPCAVDVSDNTNLWGMPPAAERVLRGAGTALVSRYPQLYSGDLRQAIAEACGVRAEEVATGAGSDDVLDAAVRAFCEPGDTVAFPDPTFVMLPILAQVNAVRGVAVPLVPGTWDLDAEGVLATGARLVYLCSPNNPTGTVASRAAVERVLAGARGVVVMDEAYAEFARDTFLDWALRYPNLLVTRTLSKAWGLAGLRVGYAVGRAELVGEVEKARGPYKVASLSERMAAAALREDGEWMRARAAEAREARELLRERLAGLGLAALPSEGNFLLVPLPGAPGVAARMREAGVAVRAFEGLTGIGDALRLGAGPWDSMEAVLAALQEAVR